MLNLMKRLFGSDPAVDIKSLMGKGAIILDVRTGAEYRTGHIKGSLNIPVNELGARIQEVRNKNRPVITCCRSGARSGMAQSILEKHGIECYNGGAWDRLQTKI